MNQVLEWLLGGDLRSDGLSSEVADFVLANPDLVAELVEGLQESQDLVRGRTADALEKVARVNPQVVVGFLPSLFSAARNDSLAMVKMHVAMLLGHLAMYTDQVESITETLVAMLDDESVFTRSWAVVSLCIIGRIYPGKRECIVAELARLQRDASIAIRTRVGKALMVLTDEGSGFPKGWVKSQHLQNI